MPKQKKLKPCKRCGVNLKLNRKGYCVACAIQRSYDSMAQLSAKKGPFYEKWKKGMLAALKRKEEYAEKLSRRWAVGIAEALKEEE